MRLRSGRWIWPVLLLGGLTVGAGPVSLGPHASEGPGPQADVAAEPHVVDYVVAAPRAAIVAPPALSTELLPPYGAVHNFARNGGALTIRTGTVVVFREARHIEGVWYDGTYGHLGSSLELQMHRRNDTGEKEWVTLGRDGARATRFGPSIGTANIRVRHLFARPGTYVLRAIVRTVAIPMDPTTDSIVPAVEDCPMADKERSVVYIRVRVLDSPTEVSATTTDPSEDAIEEMEPDDENTSEQ